MASINSVKKIFFGFVSAGLNSVPAEYFRHQILGMFTIIAYDAVLGLDCSRVSKTILLVLFVYSKDQLSCINIYINI